jgi:hypothetical protein
MLDRATGPRSLSGTSRRRAGSADTFALTDQGRAVLEVLMMKVATRRQ